MEGAALSPEDRSKTDRFLANPLDFPDEFKKWLLDYMGMNIPPIPVNQLLGFVQTRAYTADDVPDFEATASSNYTRLGITGPIIQGLNDGTYIVFHGCEMASNDGFSAKGWEALSVNGSTPSDNLANRAFNGGTRVDTSWRVDQVSCTAGVAANTIEMLYRSSTGTPKFGRRWMHAIRIA